jgi:hypothetical protein
MLEDGDRGEALMEPGRWLMEVKAEKTIPIWLSKMLSEHRMFRTSFSKYGNEYKKYVVNVKSRQGDSQYA